MIYIQRRESRQLETVDEFEIGRGDSMIYIQRRTDRQLETVDEFETLKEARAMLIEYRISDPTATYYLSRRPCNDWRN